MAAAEFGGELEYNDPESITPEESLTEYPQGGGAMVDCPSGSITHRNKALCNAGYDHLKLMLGNNSDVKTKMIRLDPNLSACPDPVLEMTIIECAAKEKTASYNPLTQLG